MALWLMPHIGLPTDDFGETHSQKAHNRNGFLPNSTGSFHLFRSFHSLCFAEYNKSSKSRISVDFQVQVL